MYADVLGSSYPKTKSWKENRDCCLWDGVTCDSISGHVIGLDLSCSQLGGIIHHNITLFHLSHLQILNLAYNHFFHSHISPNMVQLSGLKVLNLSHSGFGGEVPIEIADLSRLVTLDLTIPAMEGSDAHISEEVGLPYSLPSLEIPHFDRFIKNLTSLRQLHLNGVLINSSLPKTLTNLSSLSSLQLSSCNLLGSFPTDVLRLPRLRSLVIVWNSNLFTDASQFNNLSSALEVVDFSVTSLSGSLPEHSLGSLPLRLRIFHASSCNLSGTFPMWIWNTTEEIMLNDNHFTGKLPSATNTKKLQQFIHLDLSHNLLEGTIPSWLFTLPLLDTLYLGGNRFSGELDGSLFVYNSSLEFLDLSRNNLRLELYVFSKFKELFYLDLSGNAVSLTGNVDSILSFPKLSDVYLSSCNLSEFPDFSRSKQTLADLDLSNNRIRGEIPTWLSDVAKSSLQTLNISYNNITGVLELVPRESTYINIDIDIRANSLQGLLPLPPRNTQIFLASNNKFHGEISSWFCNLTQLIFLDVSYNRLNGNIPSSLQVLDLRSNRFHWVIPMTFTKDCTLKSLHLNENRFEVKIPRSLMRCKHLEVLDLGKNQFNDSFPRWLDNLPELKVLVLQSNNFQGSVKDNPIQNPNKNPFSKLQILDLSGNRFSGKLPLRYIKKFKALMVSNGGGKDKSTKYLNDFNYYQDSLVLTMKGLPLTYKILTVLAALDFSNNRFSGEIPDSVAQLVALIGLNISHNQLTGRIPSSLANLTLLESLDLSCNKLQGAIPPEFVRLQCFRE